MWMWVWRIPRTELFTPKNELHSTLISLWLRWVVLQIKSIFRIFNQILFQATGIYAACFSNKFSSFSHKLVYVDFQVGEEIALPGIDEHATVLTQMEASSQTIHKSLNQILDAQTHHRLRESQGRKRAEILNERVMVWSLFETFCMCLIGAFQVVVVRNFFKERKPSQYRKL